jgi:DNA-binding NtrC family response regulator
MSGGRLEIAPEMLPEDVRGTRTSVIAPVVVPDEGINFASAMSQLERELILQSLQKTGGNRRQAARLLSMSRTTLIDKLQRMGDIDDGSA